jgi:ethanolamine utilization cobalamin adenosyltransferase
MFVFANEENMKEFISQPKKYLKKAPEMPKHFRLLMLGPRGIGVHT